ncbi:MAG: site-2 protease family protein [Chloroflexi bacterium]|nr:site-2 protease family protein [Chloroflexota bacterium]
MSPSFLATLGYFLAILVVLVLAHELGHFVTAKRAGVKVLEFGVGYPPRLFGIRRGETVYSVNLVPLGGFVKMAGEEDPSVQGSLAGKSIPTRLLVLSAGSIMNALLPILLFSIAFMVPQQVQRGQVMVQQVAPGSPAEQAGLKSSDVITSVDGRRIRGLDDLFVAVNLNLGADTKVVAQRGRWEQVVVHLVPRWAPPQGQGPIGIGIALANPRTESASDPFWRAIPKAVRKTGDSFVLMKNSLESILIKKNKPQGAIVTGPIGIAQMTGEVARSGVANLLDWTAFLSLNLAIINILPIPMLDGGRVFFVVLEAARRGKRIPPEREGLVHLIGLVVLLTLVFIVSYFDILRIIRGTGL